MKWHGDATFVLEFALPSGLHCVTWVAGCDTASCLVIESDPFEPAALPITDAVLERLGIRSAAISSLYQIIVANAKPRKRR